MAKARLHGDEVIRQRKKQKSPGEQACRRNPSPERQCQSQQAGDAEEAVIQLTKILDPGSTFQRMWHADPEKVEALQRQLGKALRMGRNVRIRHLSALLDVLDFTKLGVLPQIVLRSHRSSPGHTDRLRSIAEIELRAEVS